MPWYKALLLVVYILLTIAALFAVPFAICGFIDKHVDKHRRKKNPEYVGNAFTEYFSLLL